MEICASDPDASPDVAPDATKVDLREQPPTVIQNPLLWQAHRASHQGIVETQRGDRANAVPRQVKACALSRPIGRALDDLGAEPTGLKSSAEREAPIPAPTIKTRVSRTWRFPESAHHKQLIRKRRRRNTPCSRFKPRSVEKGLRSSVGCRGRVVVGVL